MALWQITKEGVPTGALYDDRQVLQPGDEGFTVELALAAVEAHGGDGVNYVGPSPDLAGLHDPNE